MQLAITLLGQEAANSMTEILSAIADCHCKIVQSHVSTLADLSAGHLLIEGNWNHIAKLENSLDVIAKKLDVKIQKQRPQEIGEGEDRLPYCLEIVTQGEHDVIKPIVSFLIDRRLTIHEFSASRYRTEYLLAGAVFTAKFIVFIPAGVRLLSFREDFLDFCDHLGVDALLEPLKR